MLALRLAKASALLKHTALCCFSAQAITPTWVAQGGFSPELAPTFASYSQKQARSTNKQLLIPKPHTMDKKELTKETAMVAAIMADVISEKLYNKMMENGSGYIATFELIADWAIEFMEKHKDTDWDTALENDLRPLSKELHSIICWDDCVMDYAFYKLSQLK